MKRVIVCGLLTLLFAAACLLLRLGAARTQTVRTQYPAVAQEQALVGAERDTRPAALADGERIDLNTADASELTLLPGIGETLAQRIVDYRAAQGGFSDPRKLLNVTGIGEATLERLLEYVTVEGQYENSGRGR